MDRSGIVLRVEYAAGRGGTELRPTERDYPERPRPPALTAGNEGGTTQAWDEWSE